MPSKGSAAPQDAAVEHKPHGELPAHPVMMNSRSADGHEWSLASPENAPAARRTAAAGGNEETAAGTVDGSNGSALEDDKAEVPSDAGSASPSLPVFASAGMQNCQLQGDYLAPASVTEHTAALYLLKQCG